MSLPSFTMLQYWLAQGGPRDGSEHRILTNFLLFLLVLEMVPDIFQTSRWTDLYLVSHNSTGLLLPHTVRPLYPNCLPFAVKTA